MPANINHDYDRGILGYTMVEILVCVFVVAIGLIGVSQLQVFTFLGNHSSEKRSQATMLANYMMDSMRANRDSATGGDYNLGSIGTSDTPVCTAPTGSTLVARDQILWFEALKESLGDNNKTCGLIQCSNRDCIVKIFWDDSRAGGVEKEFIEIISQI